MAFTRKTDGWVQKIASKCGWMEMSKKEREGRECGQPQHLST